MKNIIKGSRQGWNPTASKQCYRSQCVKSFNTVQLFKTANIDSHCVQIISELEIICYSSYLMKIVNNVSIVSNGSLLCETESS